MPLCENPLWPCAMTGAVACVSGFRDLAVVVHGSSGCYFYPASLLSTPLFGTHLVEQDIIFGSGERLREVIESIPSRYRALAIVTTCVPAVIGEDLPSLLEGITPLVIDAPGFLGEFEAGYHAALARLGGKIDPDRCGVNIDGLNPLDPFYRGNAMEAKRLLSHLGIPAGTLYSMDTFDRIFASCPLTISVNPDLAGAPGEALGSFLGLDATRTALGSLHDRFPETDLESALREIQESEERLVQVCDKFLRRQDPPATAIFGSSAYALLAADCCHRYLDAEITCIGTRNRPLPTSFSIEQILSFDEIRHRLERESPDLVLGSSYEQSLCPDAAFVPLTPPVRGKVLLQARPIIGPEGTLHLMEEVLNACLDRKKK